MNFKSYIFPAIWASLVAVSLCIVEASRPVPPPIIEQCSLEKRGHQEALAQRWKYMETGPGRDLCFHYRGPVRGGPTEITALACLKFDPAETNGDLQVHLVSDFYEWSLVRE